MAETKTLDDIKESLREIELLQMLRKIIRTRGGDVQKVLGNG